MKKSLTTAIFAAVAWVGVAQASQLVPYTIQATQSKDYPLFMDQFIAKPVSIQLPSTLNGGTIAFPGATYTYGIPTQMFTIVIPPTSLPSDGTGSWSHTLDVPMTTPGWKPGSLTLKLRIFVDATHKLRFMVGNFGLSGHETMVLDVLPSAPPSPAPSASAAPLK